MQANNRVYLFDEFIAEERRKYLVVVIYDIVCNKRRAAFSKYLLGFGVRVQKSAFECILAGANYEKLLEGIPKHIDSSDRVRIYKLTGNADVRTWGDMGLLEENEVYFV